MKTQQEWEDFCKRHEVEPERHRQTGAILLFGGVPVSADLFLFFAERYAKRSGTPVEEELDRTLTLLENSGENRLAKKEPEKLMELIMVDDYAYDSEECRLCVSLLNYAKVPFGCGTDRIRTEKLCKGVVNPTADFVILNKEGKVVALDPPELVEYLKGAGRWP